MTIEERFWAKVDKTGDCWLWTAYVNYGGYGMFAVAGRPVRAHRWAWESLVGPIPDGLTIDHLCKVRRCVNPAHLEPVTLSENVRRGLTRDSCRKGHPFEDWNIQMKAGRRRCKTCNRENSSRQWQRKKAARTLDTD